jgi:hypothetical protein
MSQRYVKKVTIIIVKGLRKDIEIPLCHSFPVSGATLGGAIADR